MLDGSGATPISAEYSAELQVNLLGLDQPSPREPILDLGCGEHAHLVAHLRSRGLRAFGVDLAVAAADHLFPVDWFAFPLVPASWGTIVSHLGFAQQFLRQHLDPTGDAARYARRFMEILRALQPGGAFVYAPGLPFIEDLLPREKYLVYRKNVEGLTPDHPIEQALRETLGTSPFYACRIERRATVV